MVGIENLITHDEEACAGRNCSIHNPSDHHMKSWELNWREDRAIMERICPHGIGHDDPDDLAFRKSVGVEASGIHGCDGCCQRPSFVPAEELLDVWMEEAKALGDTFPWGKLSTEEENRIFLEIDQLMRLISMLKKFLSMDLNHVEWYGQEFSDGVSFVMNKLERAIERAGI